MREREELRNKTEKLALSLKKNKKKQKEKPIEEFGEEDWDNLSLLEEEVEDKQLRKKKKALEG